MNGVNADVPPCDILVDKDGLWYYRGAEIIHRDIVELFYRHLEQDGSGRYLIHWRGQKCHLEVEDTPFVVWRTGVVGDEENALDLLLHLSDGTTEILDPTSFYIGARNVPYCRVHDGEFLARFSRKAYYQLARMVEEDAEKGAFFLCIGSRRVYFPIESEEKCRTSCG